MRVQFILKKNEVYSFTHMCRRSSGLWNSVSFVGDALRKHEIEVEQIEVNDNNDIDREVARFKPDIVIIEALWVVPEKFDVLKKLHPSVNWFVHMHSGIAFLSLEGIAMGWLKGYDQKGVGIIANSIDTFEAFKAFINPKSLRYLPNCYTLDGIDPLPIKKDLKELNVGCFGAIRPLKNQLQQAIASIIFAKQMRVPLKFHINASRTETGGGTVLKNLRQLFEGEKNAQLVECHWMELGEFISYLRMNIDIGIQVSISETFNFVTANYVTAGLPIVGSEEINWISDFSVAKDSSNEDIIKKMEFAWSHRLLIRRNQYLLSRFSSKASALWYKFVRELTQ